MLVVVREEEVDLRQGSDHQTSKRAYLFGAWASGPWDPYLLDLRSSY